MNETMKNAANDESVTARGQQYFVNKFLREKAKA